MIDEDTKDKFYKKSVISGIIAPIIVFGIGTGIAYAIYHFGDTAKYDSRIALAK